MASLGGGRTPYKIILEENEIPSAFYNMRTDVKDGFRPLINPKTGKRTTIADLEGIVCEELCRQAYNSTERYIDIHGKVLDIYKMYRPTPLCRAHKLEEALDTPAKIYYKFEGKNLAGSHTMNTAVAQSYYAAQEGVKTLYTDSCTGHWATSLALTNNGHGIKTRAYMVKSAFEKHQPNRIVLSLLGGEIVTTPSATTKIGRFLAGREDKNPDIICAASEAIEAAKEDPGGRYSGGSISGYVLLHQSIIGQETKLAADKFGIEPDILIGYVGIGSFGGLVSSYMGERLAGRKAPKFIAVEPVSCPCMTRGKFAYATIDAGNNMPLVKTYTLGSGFVAQHELAGAARMPMANALTSVLYNGGYIDEVRAERQTEAIAASVKFARTEGIMVAPESGYPIKVTIDEALKCKQSGEAKTIIFALTGTGYYDMPAYWEYNANLLIDHIPGEEDYARGFATIPEVVENECNS